MHANETAGRDQGVLLTHFSNISFIDVQLVDIPKPGKGEDARWKKKRNG